MALGTSQNLYKFVGVQLNSTWIPAIDGSVDPAINAFLNGAGTSLYPTFGGLNTSKPVATFTTEACATALGVCGIDGLAITTAVMHFAKQATLGFSSGTDHVTITINDGLACIESIGASGQEPAKIAYRLYAIHDGTNAPLIYSGGASAPSPDALAEKFFLGPVKGSALFEVQSWQYNTNFSIKHETHTGLMYPTFAGIQGGDPQVDIVTLDSGLLADCDNGSGDLVGAAVTNFLLYLRKASESLGRIANATTSNIKGTVAKGYLYPAAQSGSWRQDSTHNFVLKPLKDSGAIVAFVSNSAIA